MTSSGTDSPDVGSSGLLLNTAVPYYRAVTNDVDAVGHRAVGGRGAGPTQSSSPVIYCKQHRPARSQGSAQSRQERGLRELKEKRKEAARRSRQRKRALIESMEQEIVRLREQVAQLTAANEALMLAQGGKRPPQ